MSHSRDASQRQSFRVAISPMPEATQRTRARKTGKVSGAARRAKGKDR
jgi:hypothetical protein